ncbi:MAG: tubulin-like doman-containing protein [Ardenticatenales bacterium]
MPNLDGFRPAVTAPHPHDEPLPPDPTALADGRRVPMAAGFVAQPALIVGAGGVGHRVLLSLKAELIAIYGAVPSGIRLVLFDIDDENLSVSQGDAVIALEEGAERFSLGPIPVARIRRNLANLPTIAERLPSLSELPPITAAHAAKALRPVGSLAFQWRFPFIQDQVRRALWALAGRDNHGDDRLHVDAARGVKVIQVGSVCGGTNSGMFLELGYLLRTEMEALGTLGDACVSIGVGMLPGAFRGTNSPSLAPNTVAALREVESVMADGAPPLHYRNGTVLEPSRPPFDMYLLVDAVDEGGRVWVNRDELCRMIAQSLLVVSATRLGEQGDVQMDNLDEVLTDRTADGRSTFFGSIGLARLEFPAERIADGLADRLVADAVVTEILAPVVPADIAAAVADWCEATGVHASQLRDRLARDAAGTPLGVSLELPQRIRDAAADALPGRAEQWIREWERVQIGGDYSLWIEQHAAAAATAWRGDLEGWLGHGGVAGIGGVSGALARLERLQQRLAVIHAELSVGLESARAAERSARAALDSLAADMAGAAETAWPFRRAKLLTAADAYVRGAERSGAAVIERVVHQHALNVIADMTAAVSAASGRITLLAARLQRAEGEARSRYDAMKSDVAGRMGDPALRLVDDALLYSLYARHRPAPAVLEARWLADAGGGLLALADAPDAAVRHLVRACRAPFSAVRTFTIEQAMAERTDVSPRARLAALREAALPAVNIDLTRLPGGDAALRRIEVVGVPDAGDTCLAGEASSLVSTHDASAITVLTLSVGMPYTALQAWPEYLRAYEREAGRRPLHTLPGFQTRPQEHRLGLALGLAFGLIYNRGAYFYYRPADPLDDAVRLGQGGERTLRSLSERDGLVREIILRVDDKVETVGTAHAVAVLDRWSAADAADDDLERALKRLARDYAALIGRNARLRAPSGND